MVASRLFTLPVTKDILLLFKNWLPVVQTCLPQMMMAGHLFTWPATVVTLMLFKNWLPVVQTVLFTVETRMGHCHCTLLVQSVLLLRFSALLCKPMLQHSKQQITMVTCHCMLLAKQMLHRWM